MGRIAEVGMIYVRQPNENPFFETIASKTNLVNYFLDGTIKYLDGERYITLVPNTHTGELCQPLDITLKGKRIKEGLVLRQKGSVLGAIPLAHTSEIKGGVYKLNATLSINYPPSVSTLTYMYPDGANSKEFKLNLYPTFNAVIFNSHSLPKEVRYHLRLDEVAYQDRTDFEEDFTALRGLVTDISTYYVNAAKYPYAYIERKLDQLWNTYRSGSHTGEVSLRSKMEELIKILQEFLYCHYKGLVEIYPSYGL